MIPNIDVDADSLNFGNPNIDVIAEIVVTITSVGNAPLMIFEQYIVPDEEYFYIRHGGGEVLLEPDSTHETVVAFAPHEYGDFEAMYVIESNDPDECIIEIPLVGYVLDVVSDEQEIPTDFGFHSIYPNPFNATTKITFTLPDPAHVTIEVFDLDGRKVETVFSGQAGAGIHALVWNADDASPGLYFIRLTCNEHMQARKLLLLR